MRLATQSPVQYTHSPDEAQNLQTEAESLRTMLNAVRFTLVRRLGAGGMGVVYEAYDQQRGELVALKTMKRVNPLALVRFKQEFRSLSDITHRNLVNLYELFAVEDRWFFTMELVEGGSFFSHIRHGPDPASFRLNEVDASNVRSEPVHPRRPKPQFSLDETRLRDALRQLAEGVDALHRAGKLHRDIKPSNVLVTVEGRVVLLDFGLTADLESLGRGRAVDRQVVGTVGHMSPEQAAGTLCHRGERLVQRGGHPLRGDDRAAAVWRLRRRGDPRQDDPGPSVAGYSGRRIAAGPGASLRYPPRPRFDDQADRAASDRTVERR